MNPITYELTPEGFYHYSCQELGVHVASSDRMKALHTLRRLIDFKHDVALKALTDLRDEIAKHV